VTSDFYTMPWVHTGHATDPLARRFKGTVCHGNTPFDVPFMSKVQNDLWIGGVITGLVLPPFVRHVVSLFPWEHYEFGDEPPSTELRVDMQDSENQGFEMVEALAGWVNECRRSGPVLVHCQGGLNRSALIVARSLYDKGFGSGEQIIAHLRAVRSPAVLCNKHFEREVRSWS
jgi:Dual specificity phosphatase, catalytic domain